MLTSYVTVIKAVWARDIATTSREDGRPAPGSLRAQPSHTTMVNKRLLIHARAAIKNAEEL